LSVGTLAAIKGEIVGSLASGGTSVETVSTGAVDVDGSAPSVK
jgi:hypothetical protein